MQGAIGYVQYFTDVPPALVLLHVIGSLLVWMSVLAFQLSLTVRPEEVEARADADRDTLVTT